MRNSLLLDSNHRPFSQLASSGSLFVSAGAARNSCSDVPGVSWLRLSSGFADSGAADGCPDVVGVGVTTSKRSGSGNRSRAIAFGTSGGAATRSEEHTSELQSHSD